MKDTLNLKKKFSWMWIFLVINPFFMFALFYFRFNHRLQSQILIFATLSYLLLAFQHHLKDKTLTIKIVSEYILIAILALLILQSLFF